MTLEEKELLIKDLSGRIPYRHNLWLLVREFDEDAPSNRRMLTDYIDEIDNGWVVECKPYLRPISSMTESEQNEFVQFHCVKLCPIIISDMLTLDNESMMFDWLNKHHFDYRGLIEKELALEAPEGMYNN